MPSGSRSWVLRVQYEGKRRDYGLGSVTDKPISADYYLLPLHRRKALTLNEARDKAKLGRGLARAGINPSEHWRQGAKEEPHTFRAVAEDYHLQAIKGWKNTKHRDEWLSSLQRYAFPIIGNLSVDEVDAAAIQRVLLPIWLTKGETARRVKQRIGVVLDNAHAKGWRSAEAPMRAVNQLMQGIRQPRAATLPPCRTVLSPSSWRSCASAIYRLAIARSSS